MVITGKKSGRRDASVRVRRTKSLWIAFAISLLLHAIALFFHLNLLPRTLSSLLRTAPPSRLEAQLARPHAERGIEPQIPAPAQRKKTQKTPTTRPQNQAAHGLWATRKWSPAERTEMDTFLGGLSREAKGKSGRELAQQALAQARKSGEAYEQEHGDTGAALRSSTAQGKPIERISIDLYFDAFIRKMNQSARFVKRPVAPGGYGTALVELVIGTEGAVTSFRILRAANQQAEIEYVQTVVARASPFAALPSDFHAVTRGLAIQLCVTSQPGAGGGFSRSFSSQDCED